MPGGDRTGPQSQGPKTGRGLGYCTGSDQPGYANPGIGGRGFGRGLGGGFGRGRGRWFGRGLRQGFEPLPMSATEAARTDESKLANMQAEIADLKTKIEKLLNRIESEGN